MCDYCTPIQVQLRPDNKVALRHEISTGKQYKAYVI